MQRNSSTDKPMRSASARAMRLDLSGVSVLELPPRSMKNSAAARLAMMNKNTSATRYDMRGIIW